LGASRKGLVLTFVDILLPHPRCLWTGDVWCMRQSDIRARGGEDGHRDNVGMGIGEVRGGIRDECWPVRKAEHCFDRRRWASVWAGNRDGRNKNLQIR
jgi:hypothetical protein